MSAEDWFRQAEEQKNSALAQAEHLREIVATARGVARSGDGAVSAVVAPGGALVSLELSDRSVDLGARRLQSVIVETIHRASADAAAKLESAMRPIIGDRYEEAVKAAQSQIPDVPEAGTVPKTVEPEDDDMSQDRLFGRRDSF
ncbi:YbaB/EbfC family nucleoid-associated protein [Actinokineospora sp.]|uniref:YbaB/EbfC family nucleoid-associated protein n=1 Tax=Actinokineospora sp. TaxID=1872133 RepID=UPI003D6A0C58